MTDVKYQQLTDFPREAVELDWLLSPANLLTDGASLHSAMIVALGTDGLAGVTDVLPDLDSTDRRGWWGDLDAEELWGGWPVGCKLWLLRRAKITGPLAFEGGTVARADAYTRDATKPFVTNKIASRIDVTAGRTDIGRIDVEVIAYRGPERAIDLRYSDLWTELGAS